MSLFEASPRSRPQPRAVVGGVAPLRRSAVEWEAGDARHGTGGRGTADWSRVVEDSCRDHETVIFPLEEAVIRFDHLTVVSADPQQAVEDYRALLGTDPAVVDSGGTFPLDNLELRVRSVGSVDSRRSGSGGDSGAPSGIESVGLRGHVDEDLGRWTLGSPAASAAVDRASVPFERGPAEHDPAVAGESTGSADPAAIHAVDHIVIRSRDVDGTRRLFEDGFGLHVLFDREFPEWKVRLCMCRVGDAVLEIAGTLASSEGDPKAGGSAVRDRLWGVTWRVNDIDAAHARLERSGFDVSEVRSGRRPGTRVFTVRNRTAGVPTLIIQPVAESRG